MKSGANDAGFRMQDAGCVLTRTVKGVEFKYG
jgi:hypothetical protein